jgi:hypothetical protein
LAREWICSISLTSLGRRLPGCSSTGAPLIIDPDASTPFAPIFHAATPKGIHPVAQQRRNRWATHFGYTRHPVHPTERTRDRGRFRAGFPAYRQHRLDSRIPIRVRDSVQFTRVEWTQAMAPDAPCFRCHLDLVQPEPRNRSARCREVIPANLLTRFDGRVMFKKACQYQ